MSLFVAAVIVVLFADTPLKEYISTSVAINDNWSLAGAIALGMIIFGVVVSLYPAWYITKFSPAFVIKGDFSASRSGRILRYTLVGIQFTISIVMIICSIFVYRQHQYMLSRDMGFDKENLLTVDVPYECISKFSMSGVEQTRRNAFIDKLKENPQIKDVAFGSGIMVSDANLDGNFQTVSDDGSLITFTSYPVSYNFLEVMGIDIVDGRNFSPSDEASETGALIFNKNASKNYGLTTDMSLYGHIHQQKTEIVGICDDFDFLSAQHGVAPFAFVVYGKRVYNFPCHAYIRTVAGADIADVRKYIEKTILDISPNSDPEKIKVKFFSDELEFVYQREDKLSTLIAMFSFLSIVISIIGVFGLVLFETQYRRREIGIRRVHGASVGGILRMFNRKYLYIVAACSAVAIPVSYYIISRWMEQYVYRVEMSWWVYALAVGVILLITIVTVSLRSWSAANENPTNSIMH